MEMYEKGLSDKELGESIHLSMESIRRWRINNQLPSNHFGKIHRERLSYAKHLQQGKDGINLGQKVHAQGCLESLKLGWSVPLTKSERFIAEKLLGKSLTIDQLAYRSTTIRKMIVQGLVKGVRKGRKTYYTLDVSVWKRE